MNYTMFQIDAFASESFKGNPAAVCPLEDWLPDSTMQAIAQENNLAETAFFVGSNGQYAIRWFTPEAEVDLCGHATLASAYVIFEEHNETSNELVFSSRSGDLVVARSGDGYSMNFPSQVCQPCAMPKVIAEALDIDEASDEVVGIAFNEDYLLELRDESLVQGLNPDWNKLALLDSRGLIVTAKSSSYDFICRFFAPQLGINEDPVTGSAFTKLTPYWAERLGRNEFSAKQISKRGGEVRCELKGDRVSLFGSAVKYMQATISVPDSLC